MTLAAILIPLLLACGVVHAGATNDDCATAVVVTDGTPAAEGDNFTASTTDDAEASCQLNSDFDVWFEYVATCTGQATVDTFGSSQADTVLSAYAACGGAEIVCNDDEGSLFSVVSFATSAGQSYWIRLASFGPPGDYDLNVSGAVSGDTDANGHVDLDDFADLNTCFDGPGGGLGTGCECFDFDGDGDNDLQDFATFQVNFTGN